MLINLAATEQLATIAAANDCIFAVARIAADESLYYERPGEDGPERVAIDASQFAAQGWLQILDLEAAEVETFVTIAAELDDGEAATLAIATARGFAIATDDRRALRYVSDHYSGVSIATTSTIVRSWADETGSSQITVRDMLKRIRDGARFLPTRTDPNCDWWMSMLNPSE